MAADAIEAARLDIPPPPSARANLPGALHRRFMLCVDTEEEFDWSDRNRWHESGTRSARAIPAAHRRLIEAGAQPVYLVDYPIADASEAVDAVKAALALGGGEIGAQLHPWVNPPFATGTEADETFAGNLPPDRERAKIEALAGRIEAAFGARPIVYRAGRYGVGAATAATLDALGIGIDLSIRPYFDYSAEGGPDFLGFDPHPFWAGRVLAAPLGVALTGLVRKLGARGYSAFGMLPRGLGIAARLGLLSRVALTPEGVPIAEAIEAARILLDQGVPILGLSVHSPSFEAGHTPYVRDAEDLRRLNDWLDKMLAFLARAGVTPLSCAELDVYRRQALLDSSGGAPLSPEPRVAGPVAQG